MWSKQVDYKASLEFIEKYDPENKHAKKSLQHNIQKLTKFAGAPTE